MKFFLKYFSIFLLFFIFACQHKPTINYPVTKKIDQVDNYFGSTVADPYRWLEDTNTGEVTDWVEAQNKITELYLSQISFRESLKNRLTNIWNYERYSNPGKIGDGYIFHKNNGLQEQSVVYIQKGSNGTPEVLINPNLLSDDGSVSLDEIEFSKDLKYACYSISRGGSDWREIYVLDIDTKQTLGDHINWAKFTEMSWYKDGFYYSRYDEPKEDDRLKAKNEFQKLYYHKIGTTQSEDQIVFEDKSNAQRGFSGIVTDDEKYLVISVWKGSANNNLLAYQNLVTKSQIKYIIGESEARYRFIDNIGDKFFILTDYKAPNFRLVLVDPEHPAKENWFEIIPESKDKLQNVTCVGGKLIASYLKDANTIVSVHDLDGEKLSNVELPGVGSVYGFEGKKEETETFYTFTSFTYPRTIYKYDIRNNKSELFKKPKVKFDMNAFEVKRIFYNSKDGTKIPLFIVHKKRLELDGNNPTLLYAYGGFNISMRPRFRLTIIPILENGGVYAMACIRGGGEYGEEWHKAGMLEKKQNVFDDFIAAAEYLIENKYTSSNKLAIEGASNGGTLIGVVINQRPELFKVAFPAVGVMDMLRYHKFTIGWAWVSEYGSSDDSEQFEYLYKYSPLHNIKSGKNYPATMVTTADHDDRVFPAHSFKYISELQAKHSGDNPVLIRIETKAGHGAGTSTTKSIAEYTDLWSFMFYNMNEEMKFN